MIVFAVITVLAYAVAACALVERYLWRNGGFITLDETA